MSVELYIYPQNFEDQYIVPIDYLADYDFTTLNASTGQFSAAPYITNAINYFVPISTALTWYRFGPAAPIYPTNPTSNILKLQPNGGCLQRITGINTGIVYKVSFEHTANNNEIKIAWYDGLTLTGDYTFPASTSGTISSLNFTFANASSTFVIFGAGATDSFTKNWRLQNLVNPQVSDGQVIVDLFDEKQIPLTLSVDNFQNAAEKTQSYSKSFKLPGTDRNNKIFRNVFDVTASIETNSIDFNPYRKTPIVLQENGSTIFKGFLKLLNVDFKGQNLIYNVNLYSETIQIKDVLKDKKFYDIDFSELNHRYVKSTIKDSWTNTPGLLLINPLPPGSFAGASGAMNTVVLKYPFVDWTHQATVANNPGAPPLSGPADGQPQFASLNQMFRPWMQLRYLINRIFEGAGFTWTSTFFDTADFQNLFMDFNWGANNAPNVGLNIAMSKYNYTSCGSGPLTYAQNSSWTNIPLCGFFNWTTISIMLPNYNSSTNQYIATQNFVDLTWSCQELKWENIGGTDVDITVEIIRNGGLTAADTISNTFNAVANSTGNHSIAGTFSLMAGDVVEQRWITTNPSAPVSVRLQTTGIYQVKTNMYENILNIVGNDVMQTKRGKLKQWDFLKGILTMFNLLTVADPTNNRNIIIERYDTIFPQIGTGTGTVKLKERGITKDWTEKIDNEKINLKPLTKLKKTTLFKYVTDSNDYTATNYKNAFGGFEYGSLTFDASDLNMLVGETKVEATPFAATLNKPFAGTVPQLWAPAIYKLKDDGTAEEFDNKPRILYDNGRVTMTDGTFYIPPQNSQASENANTYLQFSGFSDFPILPTSKDLNFGTNQLIGANNPTALNLFNRFFSNYYFDLYNPNTRILILKIKLDSSDINQFSFSDIVMIKNRAYRVNKINYNPGQLAKVELILIP